MSHDYRYLKPVYDQSPTAYGTFYAYYPATGEEIIVHPQGPTTEIGRELVMELQKDFVCAR